MESDTFLLLLSFALLKLALAAAIVWDGLTRPDGAAGPDEGGGPPEARPPRSPRGGVRRERIRRGGYDSPPHRRGRRVSA